MELMDLFFSKLGSGIDKGGPIFLRPLQPHDINERYLGWFQDERVTRYLESKDIGSDEVLRHLVQGYLEDKWYMYAIIERVRGTHIGNIKLGPINRTHKTASLSIVLGDIDSWGKGYSTLAITLATELAFEQFGLRKLQAGVIGGHDSSVRSFQRAGWQVEAELPFDVLHEGQAKSRVLLGVHNPQAALP
jgi:[ribosomal protein S5]-alanine N-acetyltransferase